MEEVQKVLVAIGAKDIEKSELAMCQLKDVAQAWWKMRKDKRALGGGPITKKIIKTTFLERFFPQRDERGYG